MVGGGWDWIGTNFRVHLIFFSIYGTTSSSNLLLSGFVLYIYQGCDKLRKSVVTESAKRVSGLISPYVSQIAKRAVVIENLSPVRRSSLFDEDFDQDVEDTDDEVNVQSKKEEE